MAISKSLRFEIFARDGFVCQYCGRRPPDVVLEVDHIHPQSKDGSDDPINLITSCTDCNRGKRDKVISEIAPRPDADLMLLKLQQERVEAERFLKAKENMDVINEQICEYFATLWKKLFENEYPPHNTRIDFWLKTYGPDELEYAIRATAPRFGVNQFGYSLSYSASVNASKYISGILRSRANDLANKKIAEATA